MFKIQKRIIYAIEAVIDIALNSGINPVQNISIAKRQGIPKRYLEQTLQTLVKNNILVGSNSDKIVRTFKVRKSLNQDFSEKFYGDGKTAEKIINSILNFK